MNVKFIFAALTASITAFLGGWMIFGIVFADYYESHTNEAAKILMKKPMEIWAIAVSNIAWSVLITWVLQKTGNNTFVKGFITSLWVSFLVIVVFNLSMYAFWNVYSLRFLIIDIIVSSVFWGIVGAVSGTLLGLGNKQYNKI